MPPFTTPREMGGGFTVDRLMIDSPRDFATQTQTNFFRNRVGCLSSKILIKKNKKKCKKSFTFMFFCDTVTT